MSVITEANYVSEAIIKMRSVAPNSDGTIGVTVQKGTPEWRAWRAYFYGKRMDHRALLMGVRDAYMVPTKNPADFDPEIAKAREHYAYRVHRGEIDEETRTGRMSSDMTPKERQEVLNRLAREVPMFEKFGDEATQRDIAARRKKDAAA